MRHHRTAEVPERSTLISNFGEKPGEQEPVLAPVGISRGRFPGQAERGVDMGTDHT